MCKALVPAVRRAKEDFARYGVTHPFSSRESLDQAFTTRVLGQGRAGAAPTRTRADPATLLLQKEAEKDSAAPVHAMYACKAWYNAVMVGAPHLLAQQLQECKVSIHGLARVPAATRASLVRQLPPPLFCALVHQS